MDRIGHPLKWEVFCVVFCFVSCFVFWCFFFFLGGGGGAEF